MGRKKLADQETFPASFWDDNDKIEDEAQSERVETSESSFRVYKPHEIADEIVLSTAQGVGPLTTERLVEYFGSATNVLNASLDELQRVEKVGFTLAQRIKAARSECPIDDLILFCENNGIQIVSLFDSRYPERLRQIDNPPRLLYIRGEVLPVDRYAIAVVGTRSATEYGRAQATRLTHELVEAGFTIVSGLALGIDGCAHRAALDAGGRTLAVLGGGVAKIYPREHEDLAARVRCQGALISEYHPLTSPLSGNFPARNRIVSGMSIGVLVVESSEKGGSLVTARLAAEQNREVFATPGPIDHVSSRGCHQLIREGAALVESVDDIIQAIPSYELTGIRPRASRRNSSARGADKTYAPYSLGVSTDDMRSIDTRSRAEAPKKTTVKSKNAAPVERTATFAPLPSLNDDERKLVETIGERKLAIDQAICESGLSTARVIGLIAALEFKKVLVRLEGNFVARRKA